VVGITSFMGVVYIILASYHHRVTYNSFRLGDSMSENKIEVSIKLVELEQLRKDSHLLECLRAQGVDNWDGWDDAITAHQEAYSNE
jgi:hypothetical protein